MVLKKIQFLFPPLLNKSIFTNSNESFVITAMTLPMSLFYRNFLPLGTSSITDYIDRILGELEHIVSGLGPWIKSMQYLYYICIIIQI